MRRSLNVCSAIGLLGTSSLLAVAGCDDTPVGMAPPTTPVQTTPTAIGCTDAPPGTLDLIDDMEDGNATLLGRDGRIGQWYTYHDPTTGQLNPAQDTTPPMEAIPGGRCTATTSTKAMRVTGSGWTDWGAGFGFALKYTGGKETAYDATRFRGVTFWARIGEMSVAGIRLSVGDQWSRPAGGHCDETVTQGPTACYDTFGTDFTFDGTWRRYVAPFASMGQRNFGLPRPEIDLASLLTMEFNIPASSPAFDIWIDDVAFYE